MHSSSQCFCLSWSHLIIFLSSPRPGSFSTLASFLLVCSFLLYALSKLHGGWLSMHILSLSLHLSLSWLNLFDVPLRLAVTSLPTVCSIFTVYGFMSLSNLWFNLLNGKVFPFLYVHLSLHLRSYHIVFGLTDHVTGPEKRKERLDHK